MTSRCWDPLLPLLDRETIAVDLPGRGDSTLDPTEVTLADCVNCVVDEITGRDLTDVVLVGHSLAGLTVPEVAHAIPQRLRHLVFVSATVPADGSSVADLLGSLSPVLEEVAELLGDDLVDTSGALHRDFAEALFCTDLNAEQTAFVLDSMVREARGLITEPSNLRGLEQAIPRTYVRLLADQSLLLGSQDEMIANLGGADVVDIDAGHMAMVSQPRQLADILNAL